MISKERLNALALEVATETYGPVDYSEYPELAMARQDFSHALIKAVEAESEVVAWHNTDRKVTYNQTQCGFDKENRTNGYKLIALPLVEGEGE